MTKEIWRLNDKLSATIFWMHVDGVKGLKIMLIRSDRIF